MWKTQKRLPQTVRPRSRGGVPILLCVLVFGLTAIVVYQWGRQNWAPVKPEPTHTATAYIVQRSDKAAGGETRLPFVHADDDPQRAAEMANALAERCASDRHRQWRRRTEGPCLKARQAAEMARGELRQCEAHLKTFRRQLAEAAAKPQVDAVTEAQAAMEQQEENLPLLPTTENPRWLKLQWRLVALQQRREKLLVDLTPLHPVVQDIDARIMEVQKQLAAVPRQIPDSQASPVDDGARRLVAESVAQENQRKLEELTAAVEKARRARYQAELVEKQAVQEQRSGPKLAIEYAQVVQNPPKMDHGWRRLMWTTLMAGVLMAFGVGSVSLGAGIEPPVASAAEVKAELDVPLIGTIPADGPAPDLTAIRRQWRMRHAMIVVGVVLMIVCPVAAIWGVMGI